MSAPLFRQPAVELGNTYDGDAVLRGYLASTLPPDVLRDVEPGLRAMGERAGGDLYRLQLRDRANEPRWTAYGPWGEHVEHVEPTAVWREAARVAAREGVVATAYDGPHGAWNRVHQFALAYLFAPSTDFYGCPLAMTDGAARALIASGNHALVERALGRLVSRDPDRAWTSGQWMTELPGGSDVGRTETVARRDADGTWRLWGRKWFTSALGSEMALALARPEGNPAGGGGLALFYVETRGADGAPNGFRVLRLKDKLGTRKLPTAELRLEGMRATPVAGLDGGTRAIAPMLNVTRTWNAVTAAAMMARGLALARDWSHRRHAFGRPLAALPLHDETLAELAALHAGAFHLAFRVAELLGRAEAGAADASERALLRVLTPIAKLWTAKQCVACVSEVLECFGGAGYVEDTGLPALLRDAQVLPIWEGTTNVLALDLLRAIDREGDDALRAALAGAPGPSGRRALHAGDAALDALRATTDADTRERGARRLAMTLGTALATALVARGADDEAARRLASALPHDAAARDPT